MNSRVRGCCGRARISCGGPVLDDRAAVHEHDAVATSRAKPSSWVTTIIVMPVRGEVAHHLEHLADELGIERRGRLVEQHELRPHRQRAGDRDALLLAARELDRVGVALVGEPDPLEQRQRLVGRLARAGASAR